MKTLRIIQQFETSPILIVKGRGVHGLFYDLSHRGNNGIIVGSYSLIRHGGPLQTCSSSSEPISIYLSESRHNRKIYCQLVSWSPRDSTLRSVKSS